MGQEVIFNHFNIKTYIILKINAYIMKYNLWINDNWYDIKRFTAVSTKPMKWHSHVNNGKFPVLGRTY